MTHLQAFMCLPPCLPRLRTTTELVLEKTRRTKWLVDLDQHFLSTDANTT